MGNKEVVMKLKYALFVVLMGIGYVGAEEFDASSWKYENSPLNYKNSTFNYENSELNWKNSPMNYDNSSWNPKRKSVYNEDGESVGYKVYKKDGGANYFNNKGKRIGYETKDDEE